MKLDLPWNTVPKARPRVTRNGTFMPKRYREWKKNAAELISMMSGGHTFTGPIEVAVYFDTAGTTVHLLDYKGEHRRPKHVTADIDNLCGAVLDALQDSGVIENDKQVVKLVGIIRERET